MYKSFYKDKNKIFILGIVIFLLCLFMFSSVAYADEQITDLTGTRWLIVDGVTTGDNMFYYYNTTTLVDEHIIFTSNGSNNNILYENFKGTLVPGGYQLSYLPGSAAAFYDGHGNYRWLDSGYKTITIIGGDDVRSSRFITWLNHYAIYLGTTNYDNSGYYVITPSSLSGYSHLDQIDIKCNGKLSNGTLVKSIRVDLTNRTIKFKTNSHITWTTIYENGNFVDDVYAQLYFPDRDSTNVYLHEFIAGFTYQINGFQVSSTGSNIDYDDTSFDDTPDNSEVTPDKGLLNWIEYIYNSVTKGFNVIFKYLKLIVDYAQNFVSSLTSIVSWLPSDVMSAIYGCFLVVLGISIVRFLK